MFCSAYAFVSILAHLCNAANAYVVKCRIYLLLTQKWHIYVLLSQGRRICVFCRQNVAFTVAKLTHMPASVVKILHLCNCFAKMLQLCSRKVAACAHHCRKIVQNIAAKMAHPQASVPPHARP